MLTMDVFKSDLFSATSMTAAVDKYGYVPSFLTNLFGDSIYVPVSTTSVFIEERANAPAVIQTTPRGAPPKQKGGDQRTERGFKTLRHALSSRVTSEELQNIRAFGTTTELKSLQIEIARRQMKIRTDFELTKEAWMLNMVQGYVLDADGTQLYDWASEFNQTRQAEVAFNFAGAAIGDIRKKCNGIVRTTLRKLQGLGGGNVKVVALCGDDFYDGLITSAEVRQTYINWAEAADLRNKVGAPFEAFPFGGILWVNYRGTDDNSTVAIDPAKAKFFPVGAGIFQWALSPAERFEFVNTPGQEIYSWIVPDLDRQMYADVEMATYPLPVCVMPQALGSGRAGS